MADPAGKLAIQLKTINQIRGSAHPKENLNGDGKALDPGVRREKDQKGAPDGF